MCSIRPDLIEPLSIQVARTFSMHDLEKVMLKTTGEGLFEVWVAEGMTRRQTAFKLLENISAKGVLRLVLSEMLARRVDDAALIAIIDLACPEARQAMPATSQQMLVLITGLEALRARLADPEVRARLVKSVVALRHIVETIESLHAYKSLHECLHQLQAKQFRALRDAIRTLPEQPHLATELLAYRYQLATACLNARQTVLKLPDLPIVRTTEKLWIDVLEVEGEKFHDAIDTGDMQAARRALQSIRLIMLTDPPRLNRLIFTTATILPLDDMTSALSDVVGENIPEISAALVSLRVISATIRVGVREHREWQDADMRIADFDRLLERDSASQLEELAFCWLDLKTIVEGLAGRDSETQWAKKILLYINNVDDALANKEDINEPFRLAFDTFRGAAQFRFLMVDSKLKADCFALVRIVEPLNRILEELV